MMRVKIAPSCHMSDSDLLTTLDGRPALTEDIGLPTDPPVTVRIICAIDSRHRLLTATCGHG